MLEPLKTELEQGLVVIGQDPVLRALDPELLKEPVLCGKLPKSINIIADHEGHLLPGAANSFSLPGILREQGIDLSPVVGEVRFAIHA